MALTASHAFTTAPTAGPPDPNLFTMADGAAIYESSDSGDYDAVPTVSPRRLDTNAEYHSDIDDDSNDEPLAYAILDFPDAEFPIRERSVIIGRDTDYQRWLVGEGDHVIDGVPQSRKRKRGSDDFGGMLHDPAANSALDAGQGDNLGEGNEEDWMPAGSKHQGPRRTLTAGIVGSPFNVDSEEPLIPIHSSYDEESGAAPRLKSISKRHLRIRLDEDEGWFMEVLGRNGAMLNDIHRAVNTTHRLRNQDIIQIADVQFQFRMDEPEEFDEDMLGVGESPEGAVSSGKSKKISLKRPSMSKSANANDDEDGDDDESADVTTPNQPPSILTDPSKLIKTNDRNEAIMRELLERGMMPTGKRGPGRPPKNGLLSNREFRELKKELEALKREENPDATPEERMKSGKVRKSSDANGDLNSAEKKAKKKARLDGSDTFGGLLEKKNATPDEPPEDPLPSLDSYTKEQLEKPAGTYQTLLWQILQPLFPDGLTLQQIYDQFQRRWPHYRTLPSQGWQSSIRHTVRGESFKQGDKSGKGYMHTINPENPPETKPKPATNPHPPTQYPNSIPRQAPYPPPPGGQVRPPLGAPYMSSAPTTAPGYRPPYAPPAPGAPRPPSQYGQPGQPSSPFASSPHVPTNGQARPPPPYNQGNPPNGTSSTATPASGTPGVRIPPSPSANPGTGIAISQAGSGTNPAPVTGPPGQKLTREQALAKWQHECLMLSPRETADDGLRPQVFDDFKTMMLDSSSDAEQRTDVSRICELAFDNILKKPPPPGPGVQGDEGAVKSFVSIIMKLLDNGHAKIAEKRKDMKAQLMRNGWAEAEVDGLIAEQLKASGLALRRAATVAAAAAAAIPVASPTK